MLRRNHERRLAFQIADDSHFRRGSATSLSGPFYVSGLSPPVLHRLDLACHHIREVFGGFNGPYLVGSVQERTAKPGSDVDLRLILDDETYDELMAGTPDGFATLLDFALGAYVRELTGLPIDFQIQRMSEANERHAGKQRNPLGGRHLTNWVGDARPEQEASHDGQSSSSERIRQTTERTTDDVD
jgi:hypothetical protein